MVQTRSNKRPAEYELSDAESSETPESESESDSELCELSNDISEYELSDISDFNTHERSNNINIYKKKSSSRKNKFIKRRTSKRLANKKQGNKRRRVNKHNKTTNTESSDCYSLDINLSDTAESSDTTNNSLEDVITSRQSVLNDVLNEFVDDAHIAIQKKKEQLRNKEWKINLSNNEINKLQPQYNKIINVISKVPKIQDVLLTTIPFSEQCCIVENIIILENMIPETFDYLNLKMTINNKIKLYKQASLMANAQQFDNYFELLYVEEEKKLNEYFENSVPMKYRILGSKQPFKNKLIIYNKFKHFSCMSSNNGEYNKLSQWLETVLSIPTQVKPLSIDIGINTFLKNIKYKLDNSLYGMQVAKEQILFSINNMLTNPQSKGLGMALVGPQGTGKTLLARAVADAVNLPFVSIPMGGARDSSFLDGHGYTYEGSCAGAIVNSLINTTQLNSVFFMDEIDKISKTYHGEEISKLLLHITDSTQNHDFKDKYIGNDISIDLSNIWFIYSLNYTNELDKTLKDRLNIIQLNGYTTNEKKHILNEFILPSGLSNIGMYAGDITFNNDAAEYLIKQTDLLYTCETKGPNGKSGVRQLKHAVNNILTKLNMIYSNKDNGFEMSYNIKDFAVPFVIKRNHIDQLNVLQKNTSSPPMGMYI
jgi:ATP-dependent Lon protease